MAIDVRDEALVLVDNGLQGRALADFVAEHFDSTVVMATIDAQFDARGGKVIHSTSAAPSMTEVLRAAAERRIPWVAMRRDVAPPADLISELIVGAGRAEMEAVPGFAVILADDAQRPVRRVLAIVDRGTGPISGFMTYVAVVTATRLGAPLDMLVLGAPGEEVRGSDEYEALAVNRETDLLDAAIELARAEGLRTTWIGIGPDVDRWAVVRAQMTLEDYGVVIDQIGELSISGGLRRGVSIEAAMSPGQVAELPLRLLAETGVSLVLVVDAIRLGVVPSPLLKAAAVAAAAAVVAGGIVSPQPSGTLTASGASAVAWAGPGTFAQPLSLHDRLEQARLVAVATGRRVASGSRSSRSGRSTTQESELVVPEAPEGGSRKDDVTKARAQEKRAKKAYSEAKAAVRSAEKADTDAAGELQPALAAVAASIQELAAAQAASDAEVTRAEEVRADAGGLTGMLPGGATQADAATAEASAAQARDQLGAASARGEAALADLTRSRAAAESALAELDTARAELAEAKAVYKQAKATTEVHEESYAKYRKAQEKRRAEALANVRMTPVAKGDYRITARFGDGGSRWSSGSHTGLDFAAPSGTPARAAASGKVISAEYAGSYGNQIVIDHGNGYQTSCSHLSSIGVSVGERVVAGDRIGAVGSTGNSTGPHLHFEVLRDDAPIDPEDWLGW
ncbi:MAG: M23 family metallopeptidase [Candidatus Nanopelagicales bacterium]